LEDNFILGGERKEKESTMIRNILKILLGKSSLPKEKESEETLIDDSILRIGDQVIVNQGIKHPDNENYISGYQGRIINLDEKENLVTIQWDSISLKNMPEQDIIECEKGGLDWSVMVLYKNEVTKIKYRDSKKDVKKARNDLQRKYYWYGFDDEGERIQKVIENSDGGEDWNHFEAWLSFLQKSLTFPFSAIVVDWEDNKPFSNGDKIEIIGFSENAMHGKYGIMVKADKNGKRDTFPLCCIEAQGKKSRNLKQFVSDYSFWFTNRMI
jgi:hypothetical protein